MRVEPGPCQTGIGANSTVVQQIHRPSTLPPRSFRSALNRCMPLPMGRRPLVGVQPSLHGMASKELGDTPGNWLWALDVQQVTHACNSAVLDLWEPGVE